MSDCDSEFNPKRSKPSKNVKKYSVISLNSSVFIFDAQHPQNPSRCFPDSVSKKLLFSDVVLEKFPEFRALKKGIPGILGTPFLLLCSFLFLSCVIVSSV